VRRATVHTLVVLGTALAGIGLFAGAAMGGVSVIEDEVFFTLTAPGATDVYLVGDFNNWNATVEKMRRSGDTFEISLFLVEGSYRYKFVVDGTWIVDPDNPGDAAKGSPLVLVERPAGLMLLTSVPEEEEAAPAVTPWFRYVGQGRWNAPDDKTFRDDHLVNLGVDIRREKLRGRALLQWSEGWWTRYDAGDDVILDRGFIGTDVGGLSLDAFTDDDVVWTSSDPVALVGEVGVFDYNAGYRRNGASADYRLAEPIHVRGFYADDTGVLTTDRPAIPTSELAGGSDADTTAYAIDANAADSDVLALELHIDTREFQVGIVTRRHDGRYPGTMAEVSVSDSAAVVFDTRQDTDATFYWLRASKLLPVGLSLGYGRGHGEIRQITREEQPLSPPRDLVTTQLSQAWNHSVRYQTSNRFYVGVDRARGPAAGTLEWDRVTWEFDGAVFDPSEATVDRVTFDFDWTETQWTAGCWLQYTRTDYGDTPSALLVDSPLLNVWLDWRDKFTVPNIVGIGDQSYTDLELTGAWYPRRSPARGDTVVAYAPRSWPDDGRWTPPFVRVSVGTTTRRFFDALHYNRARLSAAYVFDRGIYAMADGRVAGYDVEAWGGKETFVSGYLEAGYLYRWFNVNLGWGFDPVVFDPVVSDYMDIGRERVLRGSLSGGVTRDDAAAIGRELLSLEQLLQNVQTIKLEVVVYF
jgi:hypothetical protein